MSDTKPTNPANNATAVDTGARKRIPMSIPTRKLEVPELPGYNLHWFLDHNVPRALQAGYEMVDESELPVTQRGVGTDSTVSGNSDLGSHIKVVAGQGEDGKPAYLNLMKIRLEWWQEDQKVLEERNTSVLSAIFRDEKIAGTETVSPADRKQSYVKQALYQRPTRRAR